MAIKNVTEKVWSLPTSWNGRRYSDSSKVPVNIVTPILTTPAMTSDGCTITPSSMGSGYTTLILKYRLVGAGSWSGTTNDITSPLTYTGLAAGNYEFEVWPNGNQAYASNRVTGTVSSTETWEAQLLRTGTTGLSLDIASGNTTEWRTDEAEPYLRVNWNNGGTNWIDYYLVDRTKKWVRVKFWARHSVANKATKQLKIFGQGYPTNFYNVTFGRPGGYTSNTWGVYYSDDTSSTGNHDNDVEMGFNGTLTGGTSYTRAAPRFLTTGTVTVDTAWHEYDYYLKMNDNDTPNGEMIVFIDGVKRFHVDQQYNCGTDRQLRDFISLLNYSDQSGFYVDIKKLDVGYDRPSV